MSWLDSGKVAAADVNDSFLVSAKILSQCARLPIEGSRCARAAPRPESFQTAAVRPLGFGRIAQDCCSPNLQTPLAQAPKFKWIIGFAFGPSLDLEQLPLESNAHLTTLISKSRGGLWDRVWFAYAFAAPGPLDGVSGLCPAERSVKL